ncbi:hypothetical protein FB451DRAFT_1168252 [Mycena latifolia]|nr:hypothetical protein FB451DRAFT_1168252 [Mycena latifolia]
MPLTDRAKCNRYLRLSAAFRTKADIGGACRLPGLPTLADAASADPLPTGPGNAVPRSLLEQLVLMGPSAAGAPERPHAHDFVDSVLGPEEIFSSMHPAHADFDVLSRNPCAPSYHPIPYANANGDVVPPAFVGDAEICPMQFRRPGAIDSYLNLKEGSGS